MKGELALEYPRWVDRIVDFGATYGTDDEKMSLVFELAVEQARAHTGGPFTAAVFSGDRLLSVGMNLVEVTGCPLLHASIVAIIKAHEKMECLNLRVTCGDEGALFLSSHPCGLCIPAILLSGVSRLVYSVSEKTVERELEMERASPSLEMLRRSGVRITGGLREREGRKFLHNYSCGCGVIYNPPRQSDKGF